MELRGMGRTACLAADEVAVAAPWYVPGGGGTDSQGSIAQPESQAAAITTHPLPPRRCAQETRMQSLDVVLLDYHSNNHLWSRPSGRCA
jgi:hypothetical protein